MAVRLCQARKKQMSVKERVFPSQAREKVKINNISSAKLAKSKMPKELPPSDPCPAPFS